MENNILQDNIVIQSLRRFFSRGSMLDIVPDAAGHASAPQCPDCGTPMRQIDSGPCAGDYVCPEC